MNSSSRKILVYIFVFIVLASLAFAFFTRESQDSQQETTSEELQEISFSGKALGLDYQFKYWDSENQNINASLDSLLKRLENIAFSGSSELNRLNSTDSLFSPSQELIGLLQEAKRWNSLSGGALDVTEGPILQSWSFTSNGATLLDSMGIEFVMRNVGLQKIIFTDTLIRKPLEGKINFSKMIAGLALDHVAELLQEKNIQNFHLKLGETEIAKGQNLRGELWKSEVIFLADSMDRTSKGEIALFNTTLSTAGNPEQFYVKDSTKVSFTLDPRTGFPVNHSLLSVTVFSKDGISADVLADQYMVLGKNEAIRLDSLREDLQFILIYHERGGNLRQYISPELKKFLALPSDF